MNNYQVQSPILFLVFNRPQLTEQVFSRIRAVQPARLYIAADGPRKDRPEDVAACEQVRQVVSKVDWLCQVQILFSDHNKGCRMAVSDAIQWFFDQEEEGIILEDDCYPACSFFSFCDTLLERFRNDTRVFCITGTNLQQGHRWGTASYYFSRYVNIWGWASWRRVWKKYDRDLSRYTAADAEDALQKTFHDRFLVSDWVNIFKRLQSGEIDTWDYQFNFLSFFENGLCATPNINLISNIGFGPDATHTLNTNSPHAGIALKEFEGEIIHPRVFLPEPEADYFFLKKEHDLEARWRIYRKPKKRFKRWMAKWLPIPFSNSLQG